MQILRFISLIILGIVVNSGLIQMLFGKSKKDKIRGIALVITFILPFYYVWFN